MDQAGRRTMTGRITRRCVICVTWLGLLGVLVGCGGSETDEPEARPAEGSEQDEAAASSTTTAPSSTTTAAPRVVYEIDGAGTVNVDYSISGDQSQNRTVSLPWSEEQAEDPSRMSMLVALAGSEGDVTCRIRRGTEVLAEATLSATAGPLLSCDYPPSGLPPVTYPPGL